MLKLYGKFSISVLNERDSGKALVEKAKKLAIRQIERNKGDTDDLEKINEPIPLAVVGSYKGEMGHIKRINLLFSALFGYTKDDIVDKKINTIMPELYASNHDKFLTNFLERGASNNSEYLDKDQYLFGRSRVGYIFPIISKVRMYYNEETDDDIFFIGTFKTEPIVKNFVYMLTNKDGIILDISSNALGFFRFDAAS